MILIFFHLNKMFSLLIFTIIKYTLVCLIIIYITLHLMGQTIDYKQNEPAKKNLMETTDNKILIMLSNDEEKNIYIERLSHKEEMLNNHEIENYYIYNLKINDFYQLLSIQKRNNNKKLKQDINFYSEIIELYQAKYNYEK